MAIQDAGPSKAAVMAPLALALTGPVGAAVGLAGSMFQASRRRRAQDEAESEVREFDFDATTAASGDILGELVEREQAGLERSPVLEMAFQNASSRELAKNNAAVATAAAGRQKQLDAQAVQQARFNQTNVLRDDAAPIMEPVYNGQRQLRTMYEAPPGFAGDQVVINNIARMLNPGERLTQDDIEAIQGDPRLTAELRRIISKSFDGDTLSAGERAALIEAGTVVLKNTQDAAKVQMNPILQTANAYNIPTEWLMRPDAFMPNAVLQGFNNQAPELIRKPDEAPPPSNASPNLNPNFEWKPGPDGVFRLRDLIEGHGGTMPGVTQ